MQIWIQSEDAKLLAPILRNLKELHLQEIFPDCDLKWTLLYLEAAPSLKSFYVKVLVLFFWLCACGC